MSSLYMLWKFVAPCILYDMRSDCQEDKYSNALALGWLFLLLYQFTCMRKLHNSQQSTNDLSRCKSVEMVWSLGQPGSHAI